MNVPKKIEKMKEYRFLPLSLRIETLGGIATPLVLRGTPLPALRSEEFSTASDNQKSVKITVLMGESPIAEKNIKIRDFELSGIPKAQQGEPRIIVTFEVDSSCNIKASAVEKNSGNKVDVSYDDVRFWIDDNEVKELIRQAEENREEDEKRLKFIEAKNKAERIIKRAEKILREHHERDYKITKGKEIEKALASLGIALDEGNDEKIRNEVENLERIISLVETQDTNSFFDFKPFDLEPFFGTAGKTS